VTLVSAVSGDYHFRDVAVILVDNIGGSVPALVSFDLSVSRETDEVGGSSSATETMKESLR